jgi:hypothetical protein
MAPPHRVSGARRFETTTLPRNVRYHSPNNMAPYPKITENTTAPLRKPKISHTETILLSHLLDFKDICDLPIHRLLVTNKRQSAFPSANHCQGQLQTPLSLSVHHPEYILKRSFLTLERLRAVPACGVSGRTFWHKADIKSRG